MYTIAYIKGLVIGLLCVVPWVAEAVFVSQYLEHPMCYLVLVVCGSIQTLLAALFSITSCVIEFKGENKPCLMRNRLRNAMLMLLPWICTNIILSYTMTRSNIDIGWYVIFLCYAPVIVSIPTYSIELCDRFYGVDDASEEHKDTQCCTVVPLDDVPLDDVPLDETMGPISYRGIVVGVCLAMAVVPCVAEAIIVTANSSNTIGSSMLFVSGLSQTCLVFILLTYAWHDNLIIRGRAGILLYISIPWVITNTLLLWVVVSNNVVPWYVHLACYTSYLIVPPAWLAMMYANE